VPFDLATAAPVSQAKGFDLSSAKPVSDDSYDSSEYDDSTLSRLGRRARLSGRELAAEMEKSPADPTREGVVSKVARGAGEGVISAASGVLAAPIAGAAGIAGSMLPGPQGQGARWVQGVQRAMTFEPKSETGKLVAEGISAPITGAGDALGAIGGAAGRTVGPKTEAALRTIGEAAPAALLTLKAGKAALENRPEAPAGKEAQAAQKAEAVIRAEERVGQAGLDWGKLPIAIRKRLSDLAMDAASFDKLSPEAMKRLVQMEGLPIPMKGEAGPTKGQITRDPSQLRTEKQLSQMEAGRPIEDRYVAQNKALIDNLDTVAGKGSAKEKSAEEIGSQVAEKALGAKQKEAKAKVSDLYRKANQSAESAETVSPYPLIDYVHDHPNAASVGWILDRLKKQQIVTDKDALGQPQISRDISLREVSELRKVAERVGKSGGEGSGWAPEVKAILDTMIEGKGGEEFTKAREAFKTYKSEFDNQKAVRQLLENTGGKYSSDRKVALEDVFEKSIVRGSIEDVRNLRESLLNAESKGTRKQGRKALNDLAAQTVRYIRDEATKGPKDSSGTAEVSVPKLKQAMDRIGDDKLDLIVGKTSADQLRSIVSTAEDLKTSPPRRIAGSDTALNALTWMNHFLDHIPGVGPVMKGAGKLVKRTYDEGRSGVEIDRALGEQEYTPYRLSDANELRAFLPSAAAASMQEGRR
jgi:hypothetical protein